MLRPGDPFIIGVNYWPRRKAMYWWRNFDSGEVRDEFSLIRELGMQVVRIFLLWDDFQPTPEQVSAQALKHLVAVADIAAEIGLGLDVTFFTGHMSGPNWAPRWLLDPSERPSPHIRQVISDGRVVDSGYRNMFTDPMALAAARLLLNEVANSLKGHPGVAWWNLGNEPDLFAWPTDATSGQAWVHEMSDILRAVDPRPITCGLHSASLLENNGLRVDAVYGESDFGVMHSYPMYISWLDNPLDPDFVPFTVALTDSLSGKPCLMEEFGGCTAPPGEDSQIWKWESFGKPRTQYMASEEALAEYLRIGLPKLLEVGSLGAMLWCFADYTPELWDKPPCDQAIHERHFGLMRSDGSLKPHAEVVRSFAATKPIIRTVPDWAQLDIAPEAYYADPQAQIIQQWSDYKRRLHRHTHTTGNQLAD